MNMLLVKKVGFFLGCALIGAGLGGVFGEVVARKMEENEGDFEWVPEDADGEMLPSADPEEKPKFLAKNVHVKEGVTTDYTKFSKIKEDLDKVVKKYLIENPVEEAPKPTHIRIISLDEYSNTKSENFKVTCTYYENDDTLADGQDNVIPNIDDVVGSDALVNFGLGSEDADIVYVRNDKTATDYEVVRVHKSYTETVLGIVEKKQKPKVKKVKTLKEEDDE